MATTDTTMTAGMPPFPEGYEPHVPTIDEQNEQIADQRRYCYKMQSDSLLISGLRKLIEAGLLPTNEDIEQALQLRQQIKDKFPYKMATNNINI